ncbi:uncharacterized protein LOC130519411 [Takifugu flavidus]|uniref:uncharacterized protein LOC130519411 n=1 Tax=Takifugu flavidus TaxID=433684 RepID=UPI002544BC4A|nr:uncharacterized protein LOC130519411 [Takifugu flavidus]
MGIGCFSKNKKPMENPEPPGAQSPDTFLQGSNCQDSADPLYQQHDDTSEFNNNFQQPGHHNRKRKRYWIEDEMSELMDSVDIERPAKRPRLEEPIGWGSSQPQGWGNDQAQSTADQPHQGFERKQPSELTRTQQQHCAGPSYQQQNDISEFSNNFQQQQWYTLDRRSVGIEDEMSEPMDTGDIERPTNEQRQEEPIGWGSSQPQGWGNDQAQGTADQPHQGFERNQHSELTRTQQQHCAGPSYQQQNDISEFSNNFQQQQWYTLNRRSVGIEDELSEPMDTGDM